MCIVAGFVLFCWAVVHAQEEDEPGWVVPEYTDAEWTAYLAKNPHYRHYHRWYTPQENAEWHAQQLQWHNDHPNY